jgi:predicted dehydrogenase
VEQGKHLFVEKPVAVDPVGIRKVLGSSDLAKQKGLGIAAGTQRRHDPAYRATIQRIHDGAMGEVLAGNVYWNQGGLWSHERKAGQSDMEHQLRNWLYYTWLSGDHIVEQHVHNIDVANWVLKSHPVKANGVGGRQVRTEPIYGHIYDHFSVELEYPNGARIQSNARQQDNTSRYVGEFFMGTKGTSNANDSIRGENPFRYEGKKVNPYVQEHTNLIESIRAGAPINEGHQVSESVLTAIMAREAAYTGQMITWEEILNSDQDLTPEVMDFVSMETPPVAQPGITKLSRKLYAAK